MRATRLALTLSLLAAPALAQQSNTALMANDHYTRSHDYNLIHQRIEVSAFNWDSTSFEGRVTTTLESLRPGLDSIILDEGGMLENTAVTDARGNTLKSAHDGDTLVVFPAAPVGFHDTLTFTVAYHGKVRSGRGLTYINASSGHDAHPQQIWSQGEAMDNHFWFPTYDFPNDKATWEMVAVVPRADMAVSNGRLVSNLVHGATRTVVWDQDRPSATYLISLIVAPLAELKDSWDGIPVDYFVYHADSSIAWRLFHVTPDMIATYSRLTGIRYPWEKYAQTTVANFFGGMENVSATTLVDWLPDARAYQDRPWYRWILIPHELAHQWFGDYVTTENWANTWLNEGFAEFMPGQYWGGKLGPHAAQDYYLDEYRSYLNIEARRSMPLASMGSNNIYPKGALVLEMLLHELGPQRFWAGIHTYLTRHAFGVATTDDLRQAFLAATGENLDRFFSEWIYQAGYPQFVVTAAYDTTAHAVTLTIKQTQVDTLKPDSTGLKFTVPPVFHMPVVIRVGTAQGDVTRRVELDAREQTVTIPGVMSAPTMVIFDDGDRILKSLDFAQPTAWLANELQNDSNLWDRAWATDQLAKRPDDAAAAAALADAAEHADYYRTRKEAAVALGGFPATVAMPALEAALKDTSSAVRAGALDALGRLGGPQAAELARRAFEQDASYDVRAAAVTALGQADRAQASQVIATALTTPSYRDVIQDAALRLMATIMDTTQLGIVDSLFGQTRMAGYVLAAMGTKGSPRALALLAAHLDDPQPELRTWALQAYRFAMPRDLALKQLQAAESGLTHADIRRAVQRAIQEIQGGSTAR